MRTSRRDILFAAGATGLLAALPRMALAAPADDAQLRALLDQLAGTMLDNTPETATSLGLDRGARAALATRLNDYSPAGHARDRAVVADYAARLAAVDRSALSPADQILHDSVAYALDLGKAGAQFDFGSNSFRDAMNESAGPYVVSQQGGAFAAVPEFLDSQHRVEDRDGAEGYLARLDAFATALDAETFAIGRDAGNGVIAPDFILDNIIGQITAARALAPASQRMVTSLANRAQAKGIAGSWADRAERIVAGAVYPALDRQLAALKDVRTRATHDAGVWKFKDGEAYYAWLLRAGTTTTQSAEAIHAIGLRQNKEIQARMEPILVAQGLTKGSVGERVSALTKDPRFVYPDSDQGRADLIAYLNGLITGMRPRLAQVSKLDMKVPVLVKRVPADIQDGAAQGYMNPPALDGSRPSIYYINLKTMANWPRWQLGTLTAHETIPGHAWQGGYLAEHHDEVPVIDSLMGFNAFVEGWALYAEQLADELGAYDGDPLGRLGYLQAQQFRACRLVVDTGLHAKRWTREQAVDFFGNETGRAGDGLTSEVDRYCATPGQACGYKVGHNEILRLRAKAKTALGAKFDLRDFDDAVVTTGGVPLTVLETAIDMYVARAKG